MLKVYNLSLRGSNEGRGERSLDRTRHQRLHYETDYYVASSVMDHLISWGPLLRGHIKGWPSGQYCQVGEGKEFI